jgi:hypothetical protein
MLDATTVACVYSAESKILNFEKAQALQDLRSFVNTSLLNPDSALYINNFLSSVADSMTSDMFMILEDFPLNYNGREYGMATIGVGEFTLVGLHTLDRLQLFDASPYQEGGNGLRFTNGEEYEPWVTPTGEDTDPMEDMDDGNSTMRRRLALDHSDYGYQDNKYTARTYVFFLSLNLSVTSHVPLHIGPLGGLAR